MTQWPDCGVPLHTVQLTARCTALRGRHEDAHGDGRRNRGHIFPGLAVADAMRARGWQVVWMGNPEGMEARIVPEHGYPIATVRFGALRGKGLLRKLLLPLNLLRGFWQALGELRRIKPDVVLGMGGYVTFPGGMMAALLGRPLVVHEQNSVAGLANRVLAGVADKVVTGFPNVLAKGEWAGNPVRAEIAALSVPETRFEGRSGPCGCSWWAAASVPRCSTTRSRRRSR